MATATNGTVVGVFSGMSLATAFVNPQGLDILQVINEGGTVVYHLDKNGVNRTNPASPSKVGGIPMAMYQQNGASSLAVAFFNPGNLDLLQVISPTGQAVVFHVNYLGVASTP